MRLKGVALVGSRDHKGRIPQKKEREKQPDMDDSLEALLEKATNPRNRYEDWEFIMAFCDKVNATPDGPLTALKMISPKISDKNEKVALLALTLLEACVKNCGKPLHQELGKFRFLNDLIRLISPKYMGNETTPKVKERVQSLLYSWKVGLPHEPKIAEAYELLKKQGLVFDESVPRDVTLDTPPAKPVVKLKEEPKQSQMLRKLLQSKNPEDLRAANRLIRDMVRRDEKRMDKLKKRLDDLDTIENNIKLLNELLSQYSTSSTEDDKQLVKELYDSLNTQRPTLFKMASDLKANEEGMSQILGVNDSLIRVIDFYQRTVGENGPGSTAEASGSSTAAAVSTAADVSSTTEKTETSSSAGDNGATAAAGGGSGDLLIELADLNFGNPPAPAGLGSGLADLSGLGITSSSGAGSAGVGDLSGLGSSSTASSSGGGGNLLDDLGLPAFPPMAMNSTVPNQLPPLNIMGGSSSSSTSSTPPSQQKPFNVPSPSLQRPQSGLTNQTTPSTTNDLLAGLGSLNLTPSLSASIAAPTLLTSPPPTEDPLSVLDNLTVALETIQPGNLPPLQLLAKNGLATSLHFAKTSPAPGVAVMVVSTINTSPSPVSNFQLQVAVPKVMRVKLQPPTSTELMPYNPIQPPSNISQVMLLVNPSKTKIRLRYRVSYNHGGQEVVEMGEAADFPSL